MPLDQYKPSIPHRYVLWSDYRSGGEGTEYPTLQAALSALHSIGSSREDSNIVIIDGTAKYYVSDETTGRRVSDVVVYNSVTGRIRKRLPH